MQLYHLPMAPHPRKVNIFIAEKGIALDKIEVDFSSQQNLQDPFLNTINERGVVPVLVLDDGTRLDESLAICRYLECLYPEPSLFGADPLSIGLIAMWERRMEFDGFLAAMEAFRNTSPRFVQRGVPGTPVKFEQIPALAARGRRRLGIFFQRLEQRLQQVPYVAGQAFSMADITGVVAVDFAKRAEQEIPESCPKVLAWYQKLYERESVANSLATP